MAMFEGERGPTGDHGQDGRQGERGEQGIQGIQGEMPDEAFEDQSYNRGLAEVLGETRVRWFDKRLLIIFVLMILMLSYTLQQQVTLKHATSHFRNAVVKNCEANLKNTQAFNTFISKVQQTTTSSPLLSAAEKKQRVEFYETAKQTLPVCPPR